MRVMFNQSIGMRVPVKLWLEDIEQEAMEQATNLAMLPFAHHHVAIMPDAHSGYGMPIGGVLATNGVVIPNCVGVDIGCGMCALKTSMKEFPNGTESLKKVMGDIRQVIPVGFDHQQNPYPWEGFNRAPEISIIQRQLEAATYQMGTLGGGNHFIEIQKGSDGHIWVMIHSGSRNFGLKIANEYHEIARHMCDRWHANIPHQDLAFLPIEDNIAKEYIQAMNYALEFAKENRRIMMRTVLSILVENYPDAAGIEEIYDVHHNYARWEHHFGMNVLIHRKGATSAREGEVGIIPGSQGTKSYIVEGLGNPESFTSCSHGAGRRMGRKAAQKQLSLEGEKRKLDERGIVHSVRNTADLDEAPGAYKDIDIVMKNQEDLVKIVVELTPLGVIKG